MDAVREDHVAPATADALQNRRETGEALGNCGKHREDLLAVLDTGVRLRGGNFGLDPLDEDGDDLQLVFYNVSLLDPNFVCTLTYQQERA